MKLYFWVAALMFTGGWGNIAIAKTPEGMGLEESFSDSEFQDFVSQFKELKSLPVHLNSSSPGTQFVGAGLAVCGKLAGFGLDALDQLSPEKESGCLAVGKINLDASQQGFILRIPGQYPEPTSVILATFKERKVSNYEHLADSGSDSGYKADSVIEYPANSRTIRILRHSFYPTEAADGTVNEEYEELNWNAGEFVKTKNVNEQVLKNQMGLIAAPKK